MEIDTKSKESSLIQLNDNDGSKNEEKFINTNNNTNKNCNNNNNNNSNNNNNNNNNKNRGGRNNGNNNTSCGGGGGSGGGVGHKFRTPQQFVYKKKMWNKRQQKLHQNNKQPINNKADVENLPTNNKNQLNHHHHHKVGGKIISHRPGNTVSGNVQVTRSKFFLLDKPPRKEVIIPPTKFLLGGNISDPLNLNSLQDEANNSNTTTPSTTPIRSPITTPPKVEVIIPPNINDPLHLLDPVDSIEYEKQLVSPMKRKHRHRKNRKPKRRRLNSLILTSNATGSNTKTDINFLNSFSSENLQQSNENQGLRSCNNTNTSLDDIEADANNITEKNTIEINKNDNQFHGGQQSQNQLQLNELNESINSSCSSNNYSNKDNNEIESKENNKNDNNDRGGCRKINNDKKDLRLNLSIAEDYAQSVGGRKRKISEGPGSSKNKFRRMDSMDKIVSPVVPQPGAWKTRVLRPTRARKSTRRSTSVSESEVISPTEEMKLIDTEIRPDTPADVPELEIVQEGEVLNISSHVKDKIIDEKLVKNEEDQNLENVTISSTDQNKKPKFKPENVKYQYGNYDRYSGYRNLNEFMDVRLQVFQRNTELFHNKDILDIGCNVGHMTIAIGKKLQPKSILGIDIDRNLIARARRNLSMYVKIPQVENEINNKDVKEHNQQESKKIDDVEMTKSEKAADENQDGVEHQIQKKAKRKRHKKTKKKQFKKNQFRNKIQSYQSPHNFFPVSFPISFGCIPSNIEMPLITSPADVNFKCEEFPKNVFFRQTNYVLKDESLLNNETQQYDLIVCLSVTKWIHLNFGDNGLKLVFKRMFNQLRPGGKLILEAQNWASYRKKKNLTETIYNNYHNIDFFPNKFHEYLLSNEVGFSHSYTLGVPRHLSKGFCRPIQLYAKGDFTPNHIRWSDTYNPQTPFETHRGCYATATRPQYPLWGRSYWGGSTPTPRGAGSLSCRQTPMYNPGSQYYNPLETDSYLPSYDTEVLNRHYVFASPLYQTVWSPPASLRNSSQHTPAFGSVRDPDNDDVAPRHVYPPNEESNSPQVSNGAFNSIREAEYYDETNNVQHVYASAMITGDSSSPRDDIAPQSNDCGDSNESEA